MNQNQSDENFEELLDFLKTNRGFDFTGYKRSNLKRRVLKQMSSRAVETFSHYLDYLKIHPEEFSFLFNTILINVTSFFRDPDTWDFVQSDVLPKIIQAKAPNQNLRIWIAGCATGEEPYSLVMILAELLGLEELRNRVKIYATDIDEDALNKALCGIYEQKALDSLAENLQEKYFQQQHSENRYTFCSELRRVVIFGRHNLLSDPPISRLDLLICRNTLMYFNSSTQQDILKKFYFGLNNNGILVLGRAEMILNKNNLFVPFDVTHHLFSKNEPTNPLNRNLSSIIKESAQNNQYLLDVFRLMKISLDQLSSALIILDSKNNLLLINKLAQSMFGLNLNNIGQPLKDLEISYRPLELRSLIEQVSNTGYPLKINKISHNLPDGTLCYLDVQISSIKETELLGTSISFGDMSAYYLLQSELESTKRDLHQVSENLQSSHEELETTNEELQSTNEELETTNEELQSTNEELETINEELKSTNDELQSINNVLRINSKELDQSNLFLNSILSSLKIGVIVIDLQFTIMIWSKKAEDLWGLKLEEVKSKSLFSLDIGLPIERLREPILNCLNQSDQTGQIILESINRRGQSILCDVSLNCLIGKDKENIGIIILMKDEPIHI